MGGSWARPGQPLGSHGRPRSDFDRFLLDLGGRLEAQNRPKSIKNRCQDSLKKNYIVFGSIFNQILVDFGSILVRFLNRFGNRFGKSVT